MTATLPEVSSDLRALSDGELAALFDAGDAAARAAVLAECARQDAEADRERKRRAWRAGPAGQRYAAHESTWFEAAHGEYLAADEATRGNLLSRQAPERDAFPMLWTCSERDFDRWASEDLKRWRQFDAPSFTRKADYMRQASRPRAGDYAWHDEPQPEEATTVDTHTQTFAPAHVAAPEPPAPEPADRPAPAPGPPRTTDQMRADSAAIRASVEESRQAQRERLARAAAMRTGPQPAEVAVRTAGAVTARPPGIAPQRPDIDGARLLEQAGLFLLDYASFPSPAAAVACTLWAAHAVARDANRDLIWRATPRLLLSSAENGSGKSTVLDLLAILTRSRAGRLGTVTAPGLVQLLGQLREPAFPDEVQSTFGNGRRAEEVRRIINAGYTRRAAALTGRGAKATLTNVFGPVAMAGLDSLITDTNGRMADTLARCIVIRMQRPDRRMPELDERGEDRGDAIAAALAGWTAAVQGELRSAAQDLADAAARGEDGLDDIGDGGRVAQIWRPLLAIADVAGGMWPTAAREAIWELSAAAGDLDGAADAMAWLEDETAGRSFFDAVAR